MREGVIWGAVLVFQDIAPLKRSEKQQRLLSEATALLGSSLDYAYMLEVIASLAVPDLAELCIVDLIDDERRVQRLSPACADPAQRALAERLRELAPELDWDTPEATVLRTGRAMRRSGISSEELQSVAHGSEHQQILRKLGIHSILSVPLQHGGKILGALTFGAADPGRQLTDADLDLALELGRRAAVAIDNARHHREALEAIRSREEVVSVVSHDLKTPLSALLMSAQLLGDSQELTPQVRRSVDIIGRAAMNMTALIEQLLDFTKLSAGRVVLHRQSEVVGRLVDDALAVIEPLATVKSLRLERDLCDPWHRVVCDRDRIAQVLTNILVNAVKFTPAGGTISVRTELDGTELCFAIADTGPGVPANELPHLFDRYWQAPANARKGTGLGLAIAKGIVEAHGGRIWATSTVGQGTTFFFTLALADAASDH